MSNIGFLPFYIHFLQRTVLLPDLSLHSRAAVIVVAIRSLFEVHILPRPTLLHLDVSIGYNNMLLSPFSSPRRLILLAVFLFFAVLILIRNSQYSEYLPKYDLSKFTSSGSKDSKTHATDGKAEMWRPYSPSHETSISTSVPADGEQHNQDQPLPSPSMSISTPQQGTSSPLSLTASSSTATITPLVHPTYQQLQEKIQNFIDWTPPDIPNHWPSWDEYKDKDYDPNRWEGLDWENGYFENNGIDRLEKQGLTAEPYLPYPHYNSAEWRKQWSGEYQSCLGARGRNLNESEQEMVRAYSSLPHNFPNVSVGSADVVGIDSHSCIDRDARYFPYGANTSDTFDFGQVWWGQLQDDCLQRNKLRYYEHARAPMVLKPSRHLPKDHDKWVEPVETVQPDGTRRHSRTAVLIRTWEGYTYTENDLQAIRALVTEVSLLSGGEYQLYLLVNVKEREADIYDNPQVYQDVLRRVVPRELRDISVLWTERVCEEWYPKVGDWQVYWMQFMPLQWFSKTHPEFDYIWNWETDARYTGNHYHFLEQIAAFSKAFPRKNLWERNARFYFPDAHGDFASYLADTDSAIANATIAGEMTPVWGPLTADATPSQTPIGPAPPTDQEDDDFEWGVGEEADLITLQPIWDPSRTEWSYRHKIWNYSPGIRPIFDENDPVAEGFYHVGYTDLPRRVFINTVARFSKRMIHAMHIENLAGRSMQAEMWPASVALHHGLKAVYAPHPIWADRKWPGWYEDAVFNADSGKSARWGQEIDSPYNHDREAQFRGWSWYYSTGFPRILYRRFLGWVTEDLGLGKLGGDDYETNGIVMGDGNIVGGQGKMCLPAMLLHPVKHTVETE